MPSLVMGASGGTLALANVAPDLCVNIYDFVRTGQFDKARAIQKSILRLNNLVTAKYGVAGLKAALDMIGYFGGLPRRPILPLGEREKEEIKVALEELNLV